MDGENGRPSTPPADADEPSKPRGQHARALWSLIAVEIISVLGSEIARFGVTVWIYEATKSVYAFGALLFANTVPGLLIAPLAGHMVDRYSRKRVMIGAAIGSVSGTLIVLAAALADHLSMIPVVIGAALASAAEAFEWPALTATLPLMTSKEDLPRFNGFVEAGQAASLLAGPIIGGAAFTFLGLKGLLSVEVATFLVAVCVLATLTIPVPTAQQVRELKEEEGEDEPVTRADLLFGLRWIFQHKPMFKLLCAAVFANFFLSVGVVLMTPYCLSILSEQGYGLVSGAFGGGMIAGGLVYGPLAKRLKNAQIFLGSALVVAVLYSCYGFARSLPTLAAVEFTFALLITLCNSATLTIWQLKVPEEYSGRVLSATWMVAQSTGPLAYLLAGPIGDSLLPYLLGRPGGFTEWIGATWGTTKTGQLGTLFSAIGLILFLGFAVAARSKDIREVDESEGDESEDESEGEEPAVAEPSTEAVDD